MEWDRGLRPKSGFVIIFTALLFEPFHKRHNGNATANSPPHPVIAFPVQSNKGEYLKSSQSSPTKPQSLVQKKKNDPKWVTVQSECILHARQHTRYLIFASGIGVYVQKVLIEKILLDFGRCPLLPLSLNGA